jgi:hypothetical protein
MYIDLSCRDTLGYECQLVVAIISYYVWCTVGGFEESNMDMFRIIISLSVFTLPLALTFVNVLLVYTCSSL